jgi:hypothetical protein
MIIRRLTFVLLITIMAGAQARAYDLDKGAQAFEEFRSKPELVVVHRGWAGNDSAVTEFSVERIIDKPSWEALWRRHAPGTQAPEVDFTTEMVVAAFSGRLSASYYGLSLAGVTEGKVIEIVNDILISDVVHPGKENNQYLFAVLPRSNKRILVVSRSWGMRRKPEVKYNLIEDIAEVK